MILPAMRSQNPSIEHQKWLYNFIYVAMLIAAVLNGWGASLLYIAQGKYMAEISNSKNVGFFNSVLWVATMCTLISGNILGYFVINYLDLTIFYIILTIICFCSIIFFMFL